MVEICVEKMSVLDRCQMYGIFVLEIHMLDKSVCFHVRKISTG